MWNVHRQADRHEVVLHVPLPNHRQVGRHECGRRLQRGGHRQVDRHDKLPLHFQTQLAVRLTGASCVSKIKFVIDDRLIIIKIKSSYNIKTRQLTPDVTQLFILSLQYNIYQKYGDINFLLSIDKTLHNLSLAYLLSFAVPWSSLIQCLKVLTIEHIKSISNRIES